MSDVEPLPVPAMRWWRPRSLALAREINRRLQAEPAGERAAQGVRDIDMTANPDALLVLMGVYERSHQRLTGLEAKAIGILQALAIVAAIDALALGEAGQARVPTLVVVCAMASLGFGVACLRAILGVTQPQPKSFVGIDTARVGRDEACARYAASSAANDVLGLRINNLLSAALHDLVRCAAAAGLALGFTLL